MENQDIRSFSQYLRTLTNVFKPNASIQDRKDDLLGKILPIVQNEAAKYPIQDAIDNSYESYVTHLQVVEQKMPSQQEALQAA
jgi:hypothetical protein